MASTTASTFHRTSTLRLTLVFPNRLPTNNSPTLAFRSLQPSSSRQPQSKQLCLTSSSSSSSSKFSRTPCSRKAPINPFLCPSSSEDETLVTDDDKDVHPESQLQEDIGTAAVDDGSSQDDATGVEESPSSILASLQSYREALANNDESKIAEIETHFKSVEDDILALERKLATLSVEYSNAKDRILRISADFDNFRKRTEREHLSLVTNAQGEVIQNLLPVLDNFERAKSQIKVETEKEEQISNSYQNIYKQFVEILGSLGVVPVETIGKPFDPLLHEAIMREESTEFAEGVVIEEFRKGFTVGDRLLRPSMVKVSAGPGPENVAAESPSGAECNNIQTETVPSESSDVQSEPSTVQDE